MLNSSIMKKFIYALLTIELLFPCYIYSQSNTYCEGEWIEDVTTYTCSSFNEQVSCENIEGCSWQYSWGGWVSGGSNDCVGGQVTMTNIYCDGELVVIGCTDETASNFIESATEDDGSCVWLDCVGVASYTSLYVLMEDSICNSNLYCDDYSWDGGDCVFDCNDNLMTLWDIDGYFYNGQCDQILNCMLYNYDNESCLENTNSDLCIANPIENCMSLAVWDPVCGCDAVTYSNSGDAACNSIYDFTIGECINVPNNLCPGISILLSQGWNMIGFSCSENTNASVAFSNIDDKIVIVKDAVGNAYLPDWDFNGIGDLERGYGYLLKVSEEINNYNICD